MELAARQDLFPRTDFPIPEGDQIERTIKIYQEPDGGYALYVNSARNGQTYGPHDHGGAWAIVVAVEGRERHRMYRLTDEGARDGIGPIELAAELVVEPGNGVTLLEDGIHSIEALGEEPLLHLHCYGFGFDKQLSRKEFDLENGTYVINNDIGLIEELPLHPGDAA